MVSTGMDNLCGSVSGNSIVKPILHHCIKILGCRRQTVIIDTALSIDVCYLLPDATLAGTNGTNTLYEFTEVVLSENSIALFQTIIIQHKSFSDKFIKNLCRPLAKLSGFLAIDAIANADNGVKGIKRLFPLDLTITFLLNYFHFGNSCLRQ